MNASATPETTTDPSGLRLVLPGRVVPLGSGWTWITGGWKLFARAPLMWIISLVLVFISMVAMALVPFLGQIAAQLLQPAILAGWMVASHSLERGGDFELDDMFAGFKKNFGNLVMVGLFFIVGEVLILLVFLAFIAFTIGTAFIMAPQAEIIATLAAAGLTFTLGLLIALALLMPLIAAYWFAPALVVMHDMAPLEAMKASLFACFRNFFPFLVYSILLIPLMIIALIPVGLGLLVLGPVMLAGTYVGYREIFTDEVANVPAKPTFA